MQYLLNNQLTFRIIQPLIVTLIQVSFLFGAREAEMTKKPEFIDDAIKLDENNDVFGCYNDYILRPVYQPIYTVKDGKTGFLSGYEGLIRSHLGEETIPPEDFFKIVLKRDALFIECLCVALHIRGYKQVGIKNAGLFVNVNVANYNSVEEVEREFFYTFSQLAKHGMGRQDIVFEILETEVTNPEILLRLCNLIKTNGYKFALDDFGTSHSNVERYISVSPDIIKLDRSLFLTAMKTPETGRLLKSLISAFQDNGVKVLMEGVETIDELLFSSEMAVDMLQGFYLGRPHPDIEAVEQTIDLPQPSIEQLAVG